MKNYLFLFLLVISILACSDDKSKQQLIIGSWKFAAVDASLVEATLSHANKMNVRLMEMSMKDQRYEFKNDQTFSFVSAKDNSVLLSGTYQLTQNEMEIELKKNGDNGKPKRMSIGLLKNDSLILEENGVLLIFTR
jgi:hypothetical protein